MQHDITIEFGKHKGKKLSEIPLDYVEWMGKQQRLQGKESLVLEVKAFLAEQQKQEDEKPIDWDAFIAANPVKDRYDTKYYRTHYSEDEIEHMRQEDRLLAQEAEEEFAYKEKYVACSWTSYGEKIEIEVKEDGQINATVTAAWYEHGIMRKPNDKEKRTMSTNIVAVLDFGTLRLGLTEERKQAIERKVASWKK